MVLFACELRSIHTNCLHRILYRVEVWRKRARLSPFAKQKDALLTHPNQQLFRAIGLLSAWNHQADIVGQLQLGSLSLSLLPVDSSLDGKYASFPLVLSWRGSRQQLQQLTVSEHIWYPEFFQAVFIGINSFTALSQPFEVYMVIILMLQRRGERYQMADKELIHALCSVWHSAAQTQAM